MINSKLPITCPECSSDESIVTRRTCKSCGTRWGGCNPGGYPESMGTHEHVFRCQDCDAIGTAVRLPEPRIDSLNVVGSPAEGEADTCVVFWKTERSAPYSSQSHHCAMWADHIGRHSCRCGAQL